MNEHGYFGKPANMWEPSDLDRLAGEQEGVYLEFKKPSEFLSRSGGVFSPDVLATELSETISAFLNSDGGILLVGVQTEPSGTDRRAEFLKPLNQWVPDQTFERFRMTLTESRIVDLINGNLIPKPMGIAVKALPVTVGRVDTTVFVITVTPSPLGAHQSVRTQRYYRRTGEGDVPMLDFEIRAINSRRAGPLLYLASKVPNTSIPFDEDWRASFTEMERVPAGPGDIRYRVNLIFSVSNLGRGTANIARFDIGLPVPWRVEHYSPDGTNVGAQWLSSSGLQYSIGNEVTVFWVADKCLDVPLPLRNQKLSRQTVGWQQVIYSGNETPGHPIWPTPDRRIIGSVRLQRQVDSNDVLWLPWRAFANDMPETRGAMLILERGNTLHVYNYEYEAVSWWYPAEGEHRFEELKQVFHVG